MRELLFTNPHGLDDGAWAAGLHSCASDVAKIVAHAMSNETFRSIVATDAATTQVTRDGAKADVELESTDALLGVYEGACGVKTGYTDLAGSCFAGAVDKDGKTLYSVVLQSTSDVQRFNDTTTLWDWAYDNLVAYPLASSSESVSMSLDGQVRDVPVVAYAPACVVDRQDGQGDVRRSRCRRRGVRAQRKRQPEISLDVMSGRRRLGRRRRQGCVLSEQRGRGHAGRHRLRGRGGPGVLEGMGIWWDRLIRGFTGQPTCAEAKIINSTPLIYDKQSAYVS